MSLILLICLPLSASAAARAFLVREYDVLFNDVFCYGKQLPEGGKLEVSVGSRIVEDVTLSTLEQEDIPVTLYCLVDSATSLSDKSKQQREDILLTLSSLMSNGDSMILATIDSVLTESKPMTDRDIRDTAIKTIAGQAWYTNLFDGISQAVKSLDTSNSYNTNRCLVIISEGHDDQKSTATAEGIQKQILEANIPVYHIILGSNLSEKELALHKQLADESLGGYLAYPDRESISGSAAAQQIWHTIKGAAVIRIGSEELQAAGVDQQLLIRYDSAETRYEDTILIRAVDLPVPETEAPTEEPTETEEESESEEELPEELILYGGIGAAVLIIAIVVFVVLRKKKKDQPQEVVVSDIVWPEESMDSTASVSDFSFTPTDPISFDHSGNPTEPVTNRCHVRVVAIMHPEIAFDFYLTPNMETTFGRTEKADIVLNKDDKKLSGLHGCFYWDGKMLLVQDRGSTNGTAVNGELCAAKVWLRLENGAVLTAGKYEYRVNFKVEA